MELHDNGLLINPERINKTMKFMSQQEQDDYFRECKRNPSWEWAGVNIEYKFNEYGHRTKSVADLSHDFVLTFGCSYTEGVGLHHDQTWSWKISKYLETDVYNAANQGTGCDIQCYQASQWIKNNFPIPKIVIVQWPAHTRKSFIYHNNNDYRFTDCAESRDIDGTWYRKRYIMDYGELHFANRLWFDHFNLLWKSMNVPVLNFSWEMDHERILNSPYRLWVIRCKNGSMKARDMMHDGKEWHQETVEKLKGLLSLPDFTHKI